MTTSRHHARRTLSRLLAHTRPCWTGIAGLLLLSVLSTPLALLAPLPVKVVVDHAIGKLPLPAWLTSILPAGAISSPRNLIIVATGLLLAIALATHAVQLASSALNASVAQRLLLEFRATLFRHVQRLSLQFHEAAGSMHSTYRIAHDAGAMQHVAVDGLVPLVTSVVALVSVMAVIARLDASLALVALGVLPVLFWLSHSYSHRLRAGYRRAHDQENGAIAVVQEALSSLRVVKAFGQEDREERRFTGRAEETARLRRRLALSEGWFGLLIGMTTAAGTAGILAVGGSHVLSGDLTLGELLVIMAYLAQLYQPLRTLSWQVAILQSHMASLDRAFALLDEAPDVIERPDAVALARAKGAVSFRDVSFRYAADRPVLEQVSFDVPQGTRLGISGATGTGKTTLLNLLSRFFDPTSGQILLDGVDLRAYRLADLRAQFAVVLQEPVLFSTTIGENIAYGRPGATQADIVQAARAANVHDFIVGLPQGYDSLVGERGMSLSGGERQRISLARAFLKDAPILILDEPTSSVDTATEALIIEATSRLMQGRTTLMIAHRLNTLDHCDVRLHIDRGRVSSVARRDFAAGHVTEASLA